MHFYLIPVRSLHRSTYVCILGATPYHTYKLLLFVLARPYVAFRATMTALVVVVQIPYQPDPNLRGYVGGFSLGHHVYLTPHFNGVFFGKVRRPYRTKK